MIVTINKLERNALDDVVTKVHWTATLKVGNYSAGRYGMESFTRNEKSPVLIPFANLTEAAVIGWLTLGADLEDELQANIDEQVTPTTLEGTPWDVETV
jgi:hypothetical protein